MTIFQTIRSIQSPDDAASRALRARWDLAHPDTAPGWLEEAAFRLANLQPGGARMPQRPAMVCLCADNGAILRDPSRRGETALLAKGLAARENPQARAALAAGFQVLAVDLGVADLPPLPGLLRRRLANGTDDSLLGPAMSRDLARKALEEGLSLAQLLTAHGTDMVVLETVGTGNDPAAGALASAFLHKKPARAAGHPAGLSAEDAARRLVQIETMLAVNHPRGGDVTDSLAKVGTLELAGAVGLVLGCALARVPVITGSFSANVAALGAVRMNPAARSVLLVGQQDAAETEVLHALELSPLLVNGTALGGGVAAACLLRMAIARATDL